MEKLKAETIVPQGSAVTLQMYPKANADKVFADLEESHKKEVEQLLMEVVKVKDENARLKKELEGPGVYRIKNQPTPEEMETLRLALEKPNPVLDICREFHEGCRVARSVLFYALGIAATYQAKYFRLEFQSDRGALVRRKQRQAARLLDKARSGFYMEEETITTAQDALNGRR